MFFKNNIIFFIISAYIDQTILSTDFHLELTLACVSYRLNTNEVQIYVTMEKKNLILVGLMIVYQTSGR